MSVAANYSCDEPGQFRLTGDTTCANFQQIILDTLSSFKNGGLLFLILLLFLCFCMAPVSRLNLRLNYVMNLLKSLLMCWQWQQTQTQTQSQPNGGRCFEGGVVSVSTSTSVPNGGICFEREGVSVSTSTSTSPATSA